MASLLLLQPIPRGGSGGCTVRGFLGSALRLLGFQQGAQVPPGEVSLCSSFLSSAFRRAPPPRLGEYGHFFLSSPRLLHLRWIHTPWKKENVSVGIVFPAHGVVLCAFNGTLVMGAGAPQGKRISRKCFLSVH